PYKLVKKFDLLVLIGIGVQIDFLDGGRLAFGDVQGRGQGHGILGFRQIVIEFDIVVQLLYTVEVGLHHHARDVNGRGTFIQEISPYPPYQDSGPKQDNILLYKDQEKDDDVEYSLEDAPDKVEELLKAAAYHLEQLSQIDFIRIVLICWLVCH